MVLPAPPCHGRNILQQAYSKLLQVTDQDLDVWPKNSACVSDALRRYYYQYLSATTEAAEVLVYF